VLDRLVDLLIASLQLFQFWVIVPHYQAGVILRLGKFHRVVTPGWYLVLPFYIDEPLLDTVKPTTHNLIQQSLMTKDDTPVVVTGVLTREITDVQAALLECESVEDVIVDCSFGVISEMVRNTNWEDLNTDQFCQDARKKINHRTKEYGVAIRRFQWQDCAKAENLRLWNN
jgi:regulator of protease activity HflC (stomatin/prohibitin superfamily)